MHIFPRRRGFTLWPAFSALNEEAEYKRGVAGDIFPHRVRKWRSCAFQTRRNIHTVHAYHTV